MSRASSSNIPILCTLKMEPFLFLKQMCPTVLVRNWLAMCLVFISRRVESCFPPVVLRPSSENPDLAYWVEVTFIPHVSKTQWWDALCLTLEILKWGTALGDGQRGAGKKVRACVVTFSAGSWHFSWLSPWTDGEVGEFLLRGGRSGLVREAVCRLEAGMVAVDTW